MPIASQHITSKPHPRARGVLTGTGPPASRPLVWCAPPFVSCSPSCSKSWLSCAPATWYWEPGEPNHCPGHQPLPATLRLPPGCRPLLLLPQGLLSRSHSPTSTWCSRADIVAKRAHHCEGYRCQCSYYELGSGGSWYSEGSVWARLAIQFVFASTGAADKAIWQECSTYRCGADQR